MNKEELFKKFRAVGRAALTVNLENSHSGNFSMKCKDESGREVIAITATGSQKGELDPTRICYASIEGTNYGYYKSSSETDIHAAILQLPGAKATVHGHTKIANIVTMEDVPPPRENPRPPLRPVDPLGARYLHEVPVDWYAVGCGSKEMTETLRVRLQTARVAIVQSHGSFARGSMIEEALFNLCVTEHSGEVILNAEQLGVDKEKAWAKIEEDREWFSSMLPEYPALDNDANEFEDEPDTVDMFLRTGYRIFESRYSPFHTGSMSMRGARTVLYAPRASMPHELRGPLLEIELRTGGKQIADESLRNEYLVHEMIYEETPLKSVMHCYSSEPQAAALKAMQRSGGEATRVIPIDVEGGFLYPSIPVLPPNPEPNLLSRTLLDYHVAIVTNGGVWSVGEQSISESLHHISSVKDICMYRILASMRGLNIEEMEPKRARDW